MARSIILLLCWFMLLASSGKAATHPITASPRPVSALDTLTIEHEMAHQPFLLDTISPEAIQALFGAGWVTNKQAVTNRFIKNQTDTLITIQKCKSFIRLYAVSTAEQNFYQAAVILDPLPIFQQAIHVGQTKKEIRDLFPALKNKSAIPDLIRIGAGEAGDSLYLKFEKGILVKVEFKPYLD